MNTRCQENSCHVADHVVIPISLAFCSLGSCKMISIGVLGILRSWYENY